MQSPSRYQLSSRRIQFQEQKLIFRKVHFSMYFSTFLRILKKRKQYIKKQLWIPIRDILPQILHIMSYYDQSPKKRQRRLNGLAPSDAYNSINTDNLKKILYVEIYLD